MRNEVSHRGREFYSDLLEAYFEGASFSGHERNHFFYNIGGGEYFELSGVSGIDHVGDGRSFAVFDYDRDGWQDLVLVNVNDPQLLIFHNEIGIDVPTNVISLRFVGGNKSSQPSSDWSNRNGIGVLAKIGLPDRILLREHRAGDGLAAQNSATMIVGLGERSNAEFVEIRWPSGKSQRIADAKSGSLITVFENPSDAPNESGITVEPYLRTQPSRNVSAKQGFVGLSLKPDKVFVSDSGSTLKLFLTMATWCQACRQEVGELKQLVSMFSPAELRTYAIPIDEAETTDALDRWMAEIQPPYELLSDISDTELSNVKDIVVAKLKSEAVPASIITDGDGNVVHVQLGLPSVSKIRQLLLVND